MPRLGNREYPYTQEGMGQYQQAAARQQMQQQVGPVPPTGMGGAQFPRQPYGPTVPGMGQMEGMGPQMGPPGMQQGPPGMQQGMQQGPRQAQMGYMNQARQGSQNQFQDDDMRAWHIIYDLMNNPALQAQIQGQHSLMLNNVMDPVRNYRQRGPMASARPSYEPPQGPQGFQQSPGPQYPGAGIPKRPF